MLSAASSVSKFFLTLYALTRSVKVDFNNVKLDVVGTYILKYECKDSKGLKSESQRKIVVMPSKAAAPGSQNE